MYDLSVEGLVAGDVCEIAKKSHNEARLMFLAYAALTFVFTVAVIVATIYTFLSFGDEENARGWLGLVAAVATGAGAGLLGKNTADAKKQERYMFDRVMRACGTE